MKSINRKNGNPSGVTLVELMVSLFLTSLLLIFIVSGSLFIQRYIQTWKDDHLLVEDGYHTISSIVADLQKGRADVLIDSAGFKVTLPSGDSVRYKTKDELIYRNERMLLSPDVACRRLDLQITAFEKPTPDSILIENGYTYEDRLISIKIDLAYEGKMETFETSIRVPNDCHIF